MEEDYNGNGDKLTCLNKYNQIITQQQEQPSGLLGFSRLLGLSGVDVTFLALTTIAITNKKLSDPP
ncbi:11320_t:CDS:2 [Ambispora gerdemannii]|uniref:11320_t:CDS:1 n=1 Tax=Ambispora gerdemannii TaxID=144530 RepID=A0A9N8VXF6_9GLOM|nr:11320_t:CDS:2 [Ambispora gerdemannii]